jgi:hypothetical protein
MDCVRPEGNQLIPFAGILEESMGARNRVGIRLSYQPAGYIGWRNPGFLEGLRIRALFSFQIFLCYSRGLINYMDTKAKCRHLKN